MQFLGSLGDWWHRHAAVRELDALGGGVLGELARDNAVHEDDLYNLARRVRTDMLPRLLARVDLDPVELAQGAPAVMRDMVVVCSGCVMTRRCRRELDSGCSEPDYGQYCSNAHTIDALRRA